ncbi:MAG: acyltransferase [Acidobacteriaceae bacterium]
MTDTIAQSVASKAPSPPSRQGGRQIVGLDLIRFAAACLVVAFHLTYWNRVTENWYRADYAFGYLAHYTRIGWIGVHIFFVLSGFVIAYSAQKSGPKAFVKNRFLRLYPGVWICATITFVVAIAFGELGDRLVSAWFRSLVLSPYGTLIDGSYWTLSIEITFYATIFVLLAVNGFRHLQAVAITIATLSTSLMLYVLALEHDVFASSRVAARIVRFSNSRLAQLTLMRHGALFAMGVLLWLCLLQRWTPVRILGLAICFVGSLLSIRFDWAAIVRISGISFSPISAIVVWLISVAAIVLSVQHNSAVTRMLGDRGNKFARTLGLMTYPLYLLHQRAGATLIFKLHGHLPDNISLIITSLLCFATSYLALSYLERPLQDRLRALLHITRKERDVPAAALP